MKTKTKKILAFIAATGLLVGLLLFADAFVGNPVSWILAQKTAQKRLLEVYPDTDYQIESISYSFKDGGYYVRVQSPTSIDTKFSFVMDRWGNIGYDSYEHDVQNRENVNYRLDEQYNNMVKSVLKSPNIPYKVFIGYGELSTHVDETMEKYNIPIMDIKKLELDKQYDVSELGRQYGRLVVNIEDDEITEERAAELILDIKERMDEAGVTFYHLSFTLESFRSEESGGPIKPERIDMNVIPYSEIHAEDILQKVKQWSKETQEYYEKMDNEKEIALD